MHGNYQNILDYIKNIAYPIITSLLQRSDIIKKLIAKNELKTFNNTNTIINYTNLKNTDTLEVNMSLKDTSHTHNLEDIKNSNIVIRDENNNICSKLSDDKFTGYKLKNGTDLIDIFETKKISIDIKNVDVNSTDGNNCIVDLELEKIENTLILKRTYGYIDNTEN